MIRVRGGHHLLVIVILVWLQTTASLVDGGTSSPTGIQVQTNQHNVQVTNVEVPVRVFENGRFVGNLKKEDFEVFEDDVRQTLQAAYLIKRPAEAGPFKEGSSEEARESPPPRKIVLYFEMDEYLPEIPQAVHAIFDRLSPRDEVFVITNYRMVRLRNEPGRKQESAEQLTSLLKKDLRKNSFFIKSLLADMRMTLAFYNESALEMRTEYMENLKSIYAQLIQLKKVEEDSIKSFSSLLRRIPGKKHVIILYQKEEVTIPTALNRQLESEWKSYYERNERIPLDSLRHLFDDTDSIFHMVYVTKANDPYNNDVLFREARDATKRTLGNDFFGIFNAVSEESGGTVEATANISLGMSKTIESTDSYYLLYYEPKKSESKGIYRNIRVAVPSKQYSLSFKRGYFLK